MRKNPGRMPPCADISRRQALLAGSGLALALGALPAAAQAPAAQPMTRAAPQPDSAMADRIAAAFTGGAAPVPQGLALDLPALGDNPAAVPLRVQVTEAITEESWCEEMIVIADLNPQPLACRIRFTQAAGTAELALRLRLIRTMPVRALARMNDGRVLSARAEITVAPGACGL